MRLRLPEALLGIGGYPDESSDRRGKRRIIVAALILTLPLILLASVIRLTSGHPWQGLANLAQAVAHVAVLGALHWWPRRFTSVMHWLSGADMLIIGLATMALGGLAASGFHILWAFVSVMVALIALSRRAAAVWFGVYSVAVGITVVGGSWLDTGERPESLAVDTTTNVAGASLLIFLVMVYFVTQREIFQRQSDDLLNNILPASIAEKLKVESSVIADRYEMATVLFADVVGFTPMTAEMDADELVGLLDDIFTTLDTIAAEMGLEKIKTVGDEYMVAAGVPEVRADHAHAMAEFALATRDIVAERDFGGHRIELRIGMHSGPVVAGIIGQVKFSYDLWGDTVNTASRLETFGVPGEIHISWETRDLIADRFECEPRGLVALKGKGETETWFLRGKAGDRRTGSADESESG